MCNSQYKRLGCFGFLWEAAEGSLGCQIKSCLCCIDVHFNGVLMEICSTATLVGKRFCAVENSLAVLLSLMGFACSCHGSFALAWPWHSSLNKRPTWSHRAALFLYSFVSSEGESPAASAHKSFSASPGSKLSCYSSCRSFQVHLSNAAVCEAFQSIAALGSVFIFWHHFSSWQQGIIYFNKQ